MWLLEEVKFPEPLKSLRTQLKLCYYGHGTRRDGSLENDMMLWMTEGRKRNGRPRKRWLEQVTEEYQQTAETDQLGHIMYTQTPEVEYRLMVAR